MASSVSGYEYDVFISYRQKDNKYDGWVTEFVTSLKNEIEATFKGTVGIYFDENPHDGLRETHDVDLSLSEKVKALVMMPIVSLTYCDPESFSWQNEFLPFVEHAKSDRFGMDIKVTNGNVAKRVLPIKIHEIPAEDKKLFEEAVGSNALRSVDFIYKGPGINRPLRLNEDNPQENQNKTFYRDQINKTANSLREVLNGIQADVEGKPLEEVIERAPITEKETIPVQKTKKLNPVFIAAFILILAALGYIIYSSQVSSEPEMDRSIAVLPFADMSPDKDQEYFSEGLAEELLNGLSRVEDIKVAGRTSSFSFKGKEASLKVIGEELGVSYILEGSVRKSGDMLRISAQLIQANNGFQLWSETYDREYTASNIFDVQDEISRNVLGELKLTFMTEAADTLSSRPTENVEAYNHFLRATQLEISRRPQDLEEAIKNYKQAIELDPEFALAYARLAVAYNLLESYGNLSHEDNLDYMRNNITNALVLNSEESYVYYALGLLEHHEGEYEEAFLAIDKALKLNPNFAEAHRVYSHYIEHTDKKDKEKLSEEHLLKAFELDPISPSMQIRKANYYADKDDYDTAFEILDGIIESHPDFTNSYYIKSVLQSHDLGRTDEAFISVHKALQRDPDNLRLLEGLRRHALDLGLVELGREVYAIIKEKYPENEDVPWQEIELFIYEGKIDKAIERRTEAYNEYLGEVNDEDLTTYNSRFFGDMVDFAYATKDSDFAKLTLEQGFEIFPGLAKSTPEVDSVNQMWLIEFFYLNKLVGNNSEANKYLEAARSYDLIPKDTVGYDSLRGREQWQLQQYLAMEGDFKKLMSIYRWKQRYYEENFKAHVLERRIDLIEQVMANSPEYQKYKSDVDKDIAGMRKNVVDYLKRTDNWRPEYEISF